MNCRDFEELIGAYLDNELAGEQLAEFDQHRRECALCGMLLDGISENLTLLSGIPEVEPPPRLAGRVMEATRKAGRPPLVKILQFIQPVLQTRQRIAAAAIFILFAVALGFNYADSTRDGRDDASLVSLVDYTGNRLFIQAVKTYDSVQSAWVSTAAFLERTNNFFQTSWDQVKDAFDSGQEKKDEPAPNPEKKVNQFLAPDQGVRKFA